MNKVARIYEEGWIDTPTEKWLIIKVLVFHSVVLYAEHELIVELSRRPNEIGFDVMSEFDCETYTYQWAFTLHRGLKPFGHYRQLPSMT